MDATLYNGILLVIAALFALSFLIVLWRIVVGPNSMDRLLGMDGFVAMFQCGCAIYIAWSLNTSIVNAMMVIALLGFISTVAATRFRRRDSQ
ncbi:monovalent cation/H+ antiporter complex subunit F [Corynebacterium massiliense]|uniref:Monovalent cation/H+ antiporter subunit F n=1 Tax=Corynebacterium massiliense DSM 45435 TaxID=1121364 RepID=A0ABY7U995_9CORY|nr:monovalent cation/H+ antiporter complex subunit F [Corynebacterium massiliense]WCZ33259.1 putative monovalent cation/H+ antiporter subunit F [Corynebacterium massiliense DSM 45435]